MIFKEVPIKDAWIIELDRREDERGFFARAWCQKELESHGFAPRIVQVNSSFNEIKGTLRGMHYQIHPAGEAKFVRCIRGSIYDVVIDLRPSSPTYKRWAGVELTADNRRALYVPEYCAHGYLTLEKGSEAMYFVSGFYSPEHERGIRYDDPAIGVSWPIEIEVVSAKDEAWPLLAS